MNKNIVLLSSGHPPTDERIFHKIGKSLCSAGNKVTIISSYASKTGEEDGIRFQCFDGSLLSRKQRHKKIYKLLSNIQPDIIISSEVMPLFPSVRYRFFHKTDAKILLDITEWYPENVLMKKSRSARFFFAPLLYLLLFIAVRLVDGFIYGESRKLQRYRLLAPGKPYWYVPYFPVLALLNKTPFRRLQPDSLTLCFTGILSEERGFRRFINAGLEFGKRNPQVKLRLLVIGEFIRTIDSDRLLPKMLEAGSQVELIITGRLSYEEFLQKLSEADVFLDLRDKNFIYNNSLPIKIFDYLAVGKPSIYSDIDALKEVEPLPECIFKVHPDNTEAVVQRIEFYHNNPELHEQHSQQALVLSRNYYNWEKYEPTLIRLLSEI